MLRKAAGRLTVDAADKEQRILSNTWLRIRKIIAPIVALTLFLAAILILHRIVGHYHAAEIRNAFHTIAAPHLFLCFTFSCLSYFALSIYDLLACHYIGRPLSYRKVLLTSFLSYAFANNTGSLAVIASGAVRYRLYGGWGLSGEEVGRIMGFCMVAFWLGFLCLGGWAFVLEPLHLPPELNLPSHFSVMPVGLLFLATVAAYLLACFTIKKPVLIKGVGISLPRPALAFGQVAVAVADLLFVCAALYVLLPAADQLSFAVFVGLYLVALIAGLVSNVPGGLGVFESLMALALAPFTAGPPVIAALLVFRGIYYLLPLGLAALLLGGMELHRRRTGLVRLATGLNRVTSLLVPQIMALSTFVAGAVLLFSGSMPAVGSRLAWLADIVPLPVLELSHFFGSVAGMGLLILAAGLRKRLDTAYFLSIILLGAGIVFSLLKGLDYEEAAWLAVMLFALYSSRSQFYRRTSFFAEPFSPGWFTAVFIVLCGSIWLGFFVYRHHSYANELWWSFALHGDAPRFLRATVGAVALILLFTVIRLFRPYQPPPAAPAVEELEQVAALCRRTTDTSAHLALLGDKSLLFSDSRDAFLMYAVKGRSWIVMGDPIGPEQEADELVWRFRGLCDTYGGWPVFYEVGKNHLARYIDLGLSAVKIGEEGRVPLADFNLAGSHRKSLRYIHNRLIKDGYVFEIVPAEGVVPLLPEMKAVSDAWLADKNTREKGFSLGFFDEGYLSRLPVALVRKDGRMLAFANLWPGAEQFELSIDLMRYLPEAPQGIMDFLFIEIMLRGREQGYQWFSMGMAPLAGLEYRRISPLWSNIGAFVYRHGEHFYNFKGLREYKDKFDPVWEPRYLIFPGGFHLPVIFANLASLISRGMKGVLTK
ncbi:MAG: bifunctional lysylphosphatidylglycerol flippase/synthetase MprF [Desulfobulbaceae bacterium]|nr:bifunctional lysylphosphatidylglycerol flippase/synthetase MprF [Desulfobulbaceae bacterium]